MANRNNKNDTFQLSPREWLAQKLEAAGFTAEEAYQQAFKVSDQCEGFQHSPTPAIDA